MAVVTVSGFPRYLPPSPITRKYSRSHAAGMLSRGEYGPGA